MSNIPAVSPQAAPISISCCVIDGFSSTADPLLDAMHPNQRLFVYHSAAIDTLALCFQSLFGEGLYTGFWLSLFLVSRTGTFFADSARNLRPPALDLHTKSLAG